MAGEESPRLRCAGLSGGYGQALAFRGVDLCVAEGELLALLGPNGAGKTTMLLTIAGLLPSKSGLVEVDGVAVTGASPVRSSRAGVVLVPDSRCLFPSLTVEENLRVATGRTRADPRSILELFPALEHRWRLRAGALSGGEQQMLAMGRALVQRPKVLLVDELSLGLAPIVVQAIFAALRRVADEDGCAVVLVEQHVPLALEVADRGAVLNHGSMVLDESAQRLRQEPGVLETAYLGVGDGASNRSSP